MRLHSFPTRRSSDPAVAVQQSADDNTSIALYAKQSEEFTDLSVMTDLVALHWGQFRLGQTKDPQLRVSEVTIDALTQPTFWPTLLSLDIQDRIEIFRSYTPQYTFDRQVLIEAVTHNISRGSDGGKWTISFITSDPSVGTAFTFDVSKLGGTDKLVF